MNEFSNTIITIITAIIGVAIIAVIVSNRSNTAGVITTMSGGFSNILQKALAPLH